jgi:NAD(P)H-flavin reductase
VLVESCYRGHTTARLISTAYPSLLILAGGVGITAALPLLMLEPRPRMATVTKLYWGVRSQPLVAAVEEMMMPGKEEQEQDAVREGSSNSSNHGDGSSGEIGVRKRWGVDAEVYVSVGKRFNFPGVLEQELMGRGVTGGGTTVVVCGPPGMSDEVRLAVVGLARRGAVVRFVEERFGW